MSDFPYQPISCDLHSEYELAIMHKNTLCLTWRKDGEVVVESKVVPVDLKVKNKAEYLVVKNQAADDMFIRLDYIVEMSVANN